MRSRTCFPALVACLYLMSAYAYGEDLLVVDTDVVLRTGSDQVVGINLNYIRDHDANRRPDAKQLKDALKDMGCKWLRYPGGEKSDFHLWSRPPYQAPRPASIGWYKTCEGRRMDFDEFIETAKAVGATPYVVVAYDTEERTGITKVQFLENAVAWVKYANKTKEYGVQHWEIGNENWHNKTGNAEDLAQIVTEFSQAMKGIDPSIKIGASGNSRAWWKTFLQKAAPQLDFVSLSLYNCWDWKSYDFFPENPRRKLIQPVKQVLGVIDSLPQEHRDRLSVVVSETNSKDYSKDGWPDDNSIGHAIVTCDTLFRLIHEERVDAAMLWTTRWMHDEESLKKLWYGLGPANEILSSGRAVAILGNYVRDSMVMCQSNSRMVSGYASKSSESNDLSIFVINKGREPISKDVQFAIRSDNKYNLVDVYRLEGKGPDDVAPNWGRTELGRLEDNEIKDIHLPGVSITVIVLECVTETEAEQIDSPDGDLR